MTNPCSSRGAARPHIILEVANPQDADGAMRQRNAKKAPRAQQKEAPHEGLAALARLLARDLARREVEKGLSPVSSCPYPKDSGKGAAP